MIQNGIIDYVGLMCDHIRLNYTTSVSVMEVDRRARKQKPDAQLWGNLKGPRGSSKLIRHRNESWLRW